MMKIPYVIENDNRIEQMDVWLKLHDTNSTIIKVNKINVVQKKDDVYFELTIDRLFYTLSYNNSEERDNDFEKIVSYLNADPVAYNKAIIQHILREDEEPKFKPIQTTLDEYLEDKK